MDPGVPEILHICFLSTGPAAEDLGVVVLTGGGQETGGCSLVQSSSNCLKAWQVTLFQFYRQLFSFHYAWGLMASIFAERLDPKTSREVKLVADMSGLFAEGGSNAQHTINSPTVQKDSRDVLVARAPGLACARQRETCLRVATVPKDQTC